MLEILDLVTQKTDEWVLLYVLEVTSLRFTEMFYQSQLLIWRTNTIFWREHHYSKPLNYIWMRQMSTLF